MRKAIARGLRCVSASLVAGSLCLPALADNQMGYRLLSQQDAQDLPHNHGGLGMDIEAAQQRKMRHLWAYQEPFLRTGKVS
jgi:hypothetical protein